MEHAVYIKMYIKEERIKEQYNEENEKWESFSSLVSFLG